MSVAPVELANRLFAQAVEALRVAAGPTASDADLLAVLTFGEGVRRALDQVTVTALAALERRGTFAARGYRSSAVALADLLGAERADAKRYLSAAEHVGPRAGLDGTPLPPRLAATAAAFDAGAAGLRHVEVVARVLGSDAARRLDPQRWTAAEAQLGAWIPDCTPTELQTRGSQLVETLDVDGPQPDERPQPCVNELYLQRNRSGIRMLACDAAVVPVDLGGAGQPLDVGRATRTVPDGLRRAVTARDGGCARCGRPPSWCEVHHVHTTSSRGSTAGRPS